MYCSSSPVPSVATTSAWVSPRVNSAEPWVRGRTPTSDDDRADGLEVAAVDALAGVEDVPAHDLGLHVLEDRLDLLGVELRFALGRAERGLHLRLGGVDGGVAVLLVGDLVGFAQVVSAIFEHRRLERRQCPAG